MPPNAQTEAIVENDEQLSLTQHFWSKDKSGMHQLIQYIQSTHQDLKEILEIYMERACIEQEFGEKLAALAAKDRLKTTKQEKNHMNTTQSALAAISNELQKTAECHLSLSCNLKDQVADEVDRKIKEYHTLLDKWIESLDQLGDEKKEKITELLKIRSKYLKEHELSNGQTTSNMALLKEQYKALVEQVDQIAHEWNSTWTEACEVMEAMEEDRVELIKSNVWEYANLASATLLVQDESCESIRKQLEKCSFERDLRQCITLHSTGSTIPTTNDYVTEMMREQKRKQQTNRPKLPVKPA
ncbi:Cell division control protein 15, partial [Choanephora cucurbitarum]